MVFFCSFFEDRIVQFKEHIWWDAIFCYMKQKDIQERLCYSILRKLCCRKEENFLGGNK